MNENRTCLVAHDGDNGAVAAIAIAIVVIGIILAIIFYGGVFIGGYHSLKNYVISFKHNLIDSNRSPALES